jgi:hypothetical protein
MMGRTPAALRLERRVFLRALSLGLAAPFAARVGRLALAEPAPPATRLFVYYVPHGVPGEHFAPRGGTTMSRILEPLAPFAEHVSVIQGLSMNDGATNHGAIRATLTGFNDGAGADSIDRVVAKQLGTTACALGACPFLDGSGFTSDSFLIKEGGWVAPEPDPRKAADALFPAAAQAPDDALADEAAFRDEALALTEGELETLAASVAGLSGVESKLALHLDAVRTLKATSAGGGTTGGRPVLAAVEALGSDSATEPSHFGRVLDAQLELAAAALVAGAARVVTLQCLHVNSGLDMGFAGGPGIAKGHHDPISHSWDAAGRAEFAECQRYFYARLAEQLLGGLNVADPSDPGRTVLDNSLVLCLSEVSDGANHNSDASSIWVGGKEQPSSLPCVLIGGAGGRLATGGVVSVSRSHLDLLATVAAAMGAPVSELGGSAVNPITEVLA